MSIEEIIKALERTGDDIVYIDLEESKKLIITNIPLGLKIQPEFRKPIMVASL
ncbi:hypothetical protein PACILC2_16930 [Paenibacillus cisolokensis]|uniref:Uncharacterized protein n=1 Tax=Paenibacillus cisolokensis TaxID=1658519 RepID=A0ABQ4N4M7_9BACL|nr:hypothetical protein PACILC2_16930 [Paenibacillus cisolokensis]